MQAILALAIPIFVSGCGAGPSKIKTPTLSEADAQTEVSRFLPLEDGTVFSYDTATEDSTAKGILIVQISRPRSGRVDLRMGAHTERLEFVPGGVAYVEGGFLLKAPLEQGRSWKGRSGTVRVASVDEHANVPAGPFDGCVRTVEETPDAASSKTVTSVYCPHVGLVSVDVEAATNEGHQRETAVLKSFGPRVDVTAEPVTTPSDVPRSLQ
jgi:hypothetical protein